MDDKGNKRPFALSNQPTDSDDRGVYRLYGLPAGRYLVSLGSPNLPDFRPVDPGGTRAHFAPVYYPGVTDEAQAKVVEVKLGAEVTGGRVVIHCTSVEGGDQGCETSCWIPTGAAFRNSSYVDKAARPS